METRQSFAARPLFQSFFLGGFECSTHRTRSGRRLDLIESTAHDKHAARDYARLREHGIQTVREGLRWHRIEQTAGQYDFSTVLPLVQAARDGGMQVIWDLCHYGWPDDLDIFSPAFITRFARLVRAFSQLLYNETDAVPFVAPVNEISFFSWACAEEGIFHPYSQGMGNKLKQQLVRASIEAAEEIWRINPRARIVQIDPLINVISDPARPEMAAGAAEYHMAQFEAWDMLAGYMAPELGGDPRYLNIIGVNYYAHNQWLYPDRTMVLRSSPLYRPFRELLAEINERYHRPLFIAETGIEDEERSSWLRYVAQEAHAAMEAGVPLEGICLYPIVNHPGWEDDRHCHNGLWDYANEDGHRDIYQPLSEELWRQIDMVNRLMNCSDRRLGERSDSINSTQLECAEEEDAA